MTDPVPPQSEQPPPPGGPDSGRARGASRHWDALHLVMRGIWIFLGVLLVVAILLVVRIAMGPVSLGPVAPYLRSALADGGRSLQLEFADGAVAWRHDRSGLKDRLRPGFEFRLRAVTLKDDQGKVLLSVPQATVSLSTMALLAGEIAPSVLELDGLHLAVDWKSGDLFEALASSDSDTSGLGPLLGDLLAPPEPGTPVGYLRRIGIRGADIQLREALTGSDWTLRNASLYLNRSASRVTMRTQGSLEKAGMTPVPVEIDSSLEPHARTTALTIRFKDFNPSRLAGQSEALAKIKVADMPWSGEIGMVLKRTRDGDSGDALQKLTFAVTGGAGALTLPSLYPGPVALDGATVRGRYSPVRKLWTVEAAQLAFAGAEVTAAGTYGDSEPGPSIALQGTITNLALPLLKTYWPHELGSGAYDWVSANLTAGRATQGTFKVAITPDMWERPEGMPADALDLRFGFSGVTAHYLRPMPPIVDGVGTARLTLHDFVLNAKSGSTAGVALTDSMIRFDRIHLSGKAEARAEVKLAGSVPKVLALIDSKPLGYPSAYGLKPNAVQGQSTTDLTLTFPLIKKVTLGDVKFNVQSRLSAVVIPELFTGVALKSDHIDLAVTPSNLTGKGQIALNDLPFALDWAEDFNAGKGGLSSTFRLKGRVSGRQWDVLNLPLADFITGPAAVEFTLRGAGAKIVRGEGRFDLGAAALGFADLGWSKPVGTPASARFRFAKPAPDRMVIQDLVYDDPAMKASGSLATSDGRGLEKLVIDSLRSGKTMLAATVTRSSAAGAAADYDVAVTASSLDASFYLNRLLHSKAGAGGGDARDFKFPDFTLDAFAAEVHALEGVVTRNVQAGARYRNDRWSTSKMSGDYDKGGRFQFALAAPDAASKPGAPRRSFTLMSTNGGETARGLALFENAIGGVLTATGTMTEPGPDQVVTAMIEARDFRLTKAPILTKILTIGSLTGIRDLLSGDGISFERAQAPLTFKDGVIRLDDARAWGAAIGVTVKGEIGIDSHQAAFGGTIVPSYTANTVLGKLPILGNLILGGEGKGLFAFTYSVKGSLDNPDISVNPLSVLTPGFLRWIFEPNSKLKEKKPEGAATEPSE